MTLVPPPDQQAAESSMLQQYPQQSIQYAPQQPVPYAPQQYQPARYGSTDYQAPPPTNTLAIFTLVLALVGLSIGAVITGHISLGQISRTGEQGRGLGLVGLIIGYVGCAFWVLFWLSLAVLPLIWVCLLSAAMVAPGTPA